MEPSSNLIAACKSFGGSTAFVGSRLSASRFAISVGVRPSCFSLALARGPLNRSIFLTVGSSLAFSAASSLAFCALISASIFSSSSRSSAASAASSAKVSNKSLAGLGFSTTVEGTTFDETSAFLASASAAFSSCSTTFSPVLRRSASVFCVSASSNSSIRSRTMSASPFATVWCSNPCSINSLSFLRSYSRLFSFLMESSSVTNALRASLIGLESNCPEASNRPMKVEVFSTYCARCCASAAFCSCTLAAA